MNNKMKLISNRKFGIFFTIIFIFLSIFFSRNHIYISLCFIILSIIIFFFSIFFPKYLYVLNYGWAKFSIYISKVVNPLVLGTLYFILIFPISVVLKIFGRDELILNRKTKKTMWVYNKNTDYNSEYFKRMF